MSSMPDEAAALAELFTQVPAFDFRPDVGYAIGVIPRLARYLLGDPVKYFNVSSANFNTPVTLPDDPRAKSAVLQVIGQACFYRTDGTIPATSNEQTIPAGSIVTLTGMPTIKGFVFSAVSISTCFIAVTYYD